jgi:hypothetical protein
VALVDGVEARQALIQKGFAILIHAELGDQRGFAFLAGQGAAEFPLVPEDFGEDAVREDLEAEQLVVELLGQRRLELRQGGDDGRQVGVLDRVIVSPSRGCCGSRQDGEPRKP